REQHERADEKRSEDTTHHGPIVPYSPHEASAAVGSAVILSSRGLSAHRGTGNSAPHRTRVRGSRNPSARDGVGRDTALSHGSAAASRIARPVGDSDRR